MIYILMVKKVDIIWCASMKQLFQCNTSFLYRLDAIQEGIKKS